MIPTYKSAFWSIMLLFSVSLAACSQSEPGFSLTVTPSSLPIVSPTIIEPPSPSSISAEADPPTWSGQAVDFIGEWHRTDEYIGYPATIEITNQTEIGFDFSLEAYYQSHSGFADGTAYFTSETTAFWRSDDTLSTGCLFFRIEDDLLFIEEQGQLSFGMNVYAYGTYTTGEPSYFTNGVLERLGPERLALLQEAAGVDYDLYVGGPLKYGYFEVSDIHSEEYSGLFLEGFWPTFGYDQKIYLDNDGSVWINFYWGQCFTNRTQEEMPDFLLFPENS